MNDSIVPLTVKYPQKYSVDTLDVIYDTAKDIPAQKVGAHRVSCSAARKEEWLRQSHGGFHQSLDGPR